MIFFIILLCKLCVVLTYVNIFISDQLTLIILQGRKHIFTIHARSMSVEKDIRYELLARLCPNSTGRYQHLLSAQTPNQWELAGHSVYHPC